VDTGTAGATLKFDGGLYAGSESYGADDYVFTLPSKVIGSIETGSAATITLKGSGNEISSAAIGEAGALAFDNTGSIPTKAIRLNSGAGSISTAAGNTATVGFDATSVTFGGKPVINNLKLDVGPSLAANSIVIGPNAEFKLLASSLKSYSANSGSSVDPQYEVDASSSEIVFTTNAGASVTFSYSGITGNSADAVLSGSSADNTIKILGGKSITLDRVKLKLDSAGTVAIEPSASLILGAAGNIIAGGNDTSTERPANKPGIIFAYKSETYGGSLAVGSAGEVQYVGSIAVGSIGTAANNYILPNSGFSFGSIGAVPPSAGTLTAINGIAAADFLEAASEAGAAGSVTVWQVGNGADS
jgi:hypothetical protein